MCTYIPGKRRANIPVSILVTWAPATLEVCSSFMHVEGPVTMPRQDEQIVIIALCTDVLMLFSPSWNFL